MSAPFKVSVIIPTYNRSELVERAIRSVQRQTFEDLEIIIVDDSSDDNTPQVIDNIDDDRIIYKRHDENRGGGHARNTGIETASGKYLAFLDSDDQWLPSKIEKQLKIFENGADDLGIVYCSRYNKYLGTRCVKAEEINAKSGDVHKDLLQGWMELHTSQIMVKKQCFEECGNFDVEFPSFQEYDLMIRMTKKYQVEYYHQPLVVKMTGYYDSISKNPRSRSAGLNKFIQKHGREIDEVKEGGKEEFYQERIRWHKLTMIEEIREGNHYKGLKAFRKYMKRQNTCLQKIEGLVVLFVLIFGSESNFENLDKLRFAYFSLYE